MAITSKLSERELLLLRGHCNAVPISRRTEFEAMFLRVCNDLRNIRELDGKTSVVQFSAYSPPMPIIPESLLINLGQQGTRLQEVSRTVATYELRQLFTTSLLHQYGVVLLGDNSTTGYGKSQLALRLAVLWCIAFNQTTGAPPDHATVVFCNTLDVIRTVKFWKGMIVIFDEFAPRDFSQIIHLSEDGTRGGCWLGLPCHINLAAPPLVLPSGDP